MATINLSILKAAATDGLLNGEQHPWAHPSINTANLIIAAIGPTGADREQIQHRTGLSREGVLQYCRALNKLKLIQIAPQPKAQGKANLYFLEPNYK